MSSSLSNSPLDTKRDRFLERATAANFAIHGIVMVVMTVLLARMHPGGGETDIARRIRMIAEYIRTRSDGCIVGF